MACPGMCQGQVRIEHLGLTADGDRVCRRAWLERFVHGVGRVKGTLIRIFSTTDCTCLQEVRRGLDKAEVYSIALSPNVQRLAVSCDKGTVHMFRLSESCRGRCK